MGNSAHEEQERLKALHNFQVLDTSAEQEYDDITLLASYICETPIALISLVDEHRQWFKSKIGLAVDETPRDVAFCHHAIMQSDIMVINDAFEDHRFAQNPLVTSDPNIRFYAGAQLTTSDGYDIGTLCVIDRKPRDLNDEQKKALRALSRQVMSQLELHHVTRQFKLSNETQHQTIKELKDALTKIDSLEKMIPICANCKNIRDDDGFWNGVEVFMNSHSNNTFTHSICPTCKTEMLKELRNSDHKGDE